ncbi:hypothetical protein DFH08DRAFT_980884 [Mycena albidolilacea]|uniref:HNH nuclease domain-containing protein n=1 Tax=Mycena albidolilacea TaxID=1033008 RepID=A0AAD7F3V1_9AGAR|nr:hypothetical protein DFH08DRAFT_980884 [Mycena albidolilacea]
MFGLQDVIQRLTTLSDTASASEVHDLNNILSLDVHIHSAFGHLKVAFEPVACELNTYDVFFVYPGRALGLHGLKNRFTLIDHSAGVTQKQKLKQVNDGLPLPEPRLLVLHAVCVRVAHMSGAAEVLDNFDRDMEESVVFASDGSSAHSIDMMLSPLVSATV